MFKNFPLAAVLTMRQQAESTEERALGHLRAEMQRAIASMEVLAEEMRQHTRHRASQRGQTILAAECQWDALRWKELQERFSSLAQQMNLLEARMREQQARYVSARRNREIVTNLHEKYEKAQRMNEETQARKRLEDIVSTRFALRR